MNQINTVRLAQDHQAKNETIAWEDIVRLLPTIEDTEQGRKFWKVEADTGLIKQDLNHGSQLAKKTLDVFNSYPHASQLLRRILRDIDYESKVAQGFLSEIEEQLSGSIAAA